MSESIDIVLPGAFITKQLVDCGRFFDLAGKPVSLKWLEEIAYVLKRNRENQCSVIDIFTTESVRNEIGPMIVERFKAMYGIDPGDFREMLKPCPLGPYLEFSLPAVKLAFFTIGDDDPPQMWMLDFSDMTKEFALMSPNRHALITGFKGFSE